MTSQRHRDGVGIGVRAAPLAGFLPNCIDCADAPRQRIDDVEVPQHFLLMRKRHAESCQWQFVR